MSKKLPLPTLKKGEAPCYDVWDNLYSSDFYWALRHPQNPNFYLSSISGWWKKKPVWTTDLSKALLGTPTLWEFECPAWQAMDWFKDHRCFCERPEPVFVTIGVSNQP